MTTDDRLDRLAERRLAERHLALSESLELTHHQHEEEMQQIRATLAENAEANRRTESALRRAIELSTREARAERERRRSSITDLYSLMTKLAAAQITTEERLQRLIDSSTP